MKAENFQRSFLLILVVGVTVLFLWMIRDFIMTLVFAAIFSSLARPLYERFLLWTRGRKGLSSALALLVFVLLIVLPLFSFVGLVANQAVKVTDTVTPWVQENVGDKQALNENLKRLPGYKYVAPYSDQILNKVGGMVSGLGNFIFKRASAITAGTLIFIINFAIMLYAMFFFFIDGDRMLDKILYCIPLKNSDEKRLLNSFKSMARATIKGLVIIGTVQGTLAGLALWAAGIPSALFWGTVMAILSMIPNVGSALVWVPACIFLFIKGQTTAATLVFLWCALIVGSADNVLRPILVGKDTSVPELLVLVSTLGGLTLWGLSGFILGPILAVVFLTVLDIYGTKFKDVLPETE